MAGHRTVMGVAIVAHLALAACSPSETVRPAATPTLSPEARQAVLEQDVASLRDEVRRLGLSVSRLQAGGDELAVRQDMLEGRVALLEVTPTPTPVEPPRPEPPAAPSRVETPQAPEPTPSMVSPDDLYRQGLDSFEKGNPRKAVLLFQEYLVNYKTTDLADNAQYWIGESYYTLGEIGKALAAFEAVIANYPRGNKVPAALIKIAFCYQKLGEKEKGLKGFREVIERFPKSPEARIARDNLGKQ